ncbi:carbohydrate ABC transporter permease [Kribbella pittospori]|uniref:Carbohydrate ABC transporter permease n=1 Tax=Kribbella pittospori TaxID=722689 RepID=A0A4R0KAX4_9ACTN|nr:carbohydrate ABC transporter permease [Kribbella pittospori]TCC55108.1 carbohydrate ABC transporter permease [Kribbella pittospori]
MISRFERVSNYVIVIALTVAVLFPVAWFLLTSLSPNTSGALDFTDVAWSNFSAAWRDGNLAHSMYASLVITVSAVIGQTLLAILSGYAFGVLGVVGERFLFPVILLGMMVSTEVIVIPLYYEFQQIGLTNSWLGLVIIQLGMGVPFGTYWMRATFRALPRSVMDSAAVDGAGVWSTLWRILVPMARPAVLTLVILSFMWTWNDFFLSLIFLGDPEKQTATVALGAFQGRHVLQVNLMAAGSLIVSLPVVALYLFFQREFISGVMAGAVKE